MQTLPNELINEIFHNIHKITDKRQFLKTNSNNNNITKKIFVEYKKNFKVEHFIKTG